jgi:hypothetical protein
MGEKGRWFGFVALALAVLSPACSGKVELTGTDAAKGGQSGAAAASAGANHTMVHSMGGSSIGGAAPVSGGAGAPSPMLSVGGAASSPGAGGAANMGSSGAMGSNGAAGALVACAGACGALLTPVAGWVDAASNPLMIQGAIFAYADATSKLSLMSNFSGASACISGTAARVDLASEPCTTHMFTPPALDCYAEYWGAAIELNLNQSHDPATMTGDVPAPFDASALSGFAFDLSGSNLPAPRNLRFEVESADGEFCNIPSTKLMQGSNVLLFRDLVTGCFKSPVPTAPTAETAKSALVRLLWHVVTNTSAAVPFDFCVSNIRALPK